MLYTFPSVSLDEINWIPPRWPCYCFSGRERRWLVLCTCRNFSYWRWWCWRKFRPGKLSENLCRHIINRPWNVGSRVRRNSREKEPRSISPGNKFIKERNEIIIFRWLRTWEDWSEVKTMLADYAKLLITRSRNFGLLDILILCAIIWA